MLSKQNLHGKNMPIFWFYVIFSKKDVINYTFFYNILKGHKTCFKKASNFILISHRRTPLRARKHLHHFWNNSIQVEWVGCREVVCNRLPVAATALMLVVWFFILNEGLENRSQHGNTFELCQGRYISNDLNFMRPKTLRNKVKN